MPIYISDVGEEDLNALLSIKVSFQQSVSLPSSSSLCVIPVICKLAQNVSDCGDPVGFTVVHTAQGKTLIFLLLLVCNFFGKIACCLVSHPCRPMDVFRRSVPRAEMMLSDADYLY